MCDGSSGRQGVKAASGAAGVEEEGRAEMEGALGRDPSVRRAQIASFAIHIGPA